MPCYHPNVLDLDINHPLKENGKSRYNFLGRYHGGADDIISSGSDSMVLVPCKHCIGCKLSYARSWADRMLLELDHSKTAVFITLTYDESNVPWSHGVDGNMYQTLVKGDMQLYHKRLRKYFTGREIRMFYAGEYGPKHGRPHYHEILFGLSLDDFPDIYPWDTNELGQVSYRSPLLESLWADAHCKFKGICTLSPASYKTFGYVARYCMKKVYKNNGAQEVYDNLGRIPEFVCMSRNPGLGGYYLKEHGFENLSFSMYDGTESKSVIIPSKLFEIEQLTEPELYAKIKAERKEIALDSIRAVMLGSDLDYVHYLQNQEQVTMRKITSLKRGDY